MCLYLTKQQIYELTLVTRDKFRSLFKNGAQYGTKKEQCKQRKHIVIFSFIVLNLLYACRIHIHILKYM